MNGYLFEVRAPGSKNLIRTLRAESFSDAAGQIGAKVTSIHGRNATAETVVVMAIGDYGVAPLIVHLGGSILTE